ncbi:uncharacterized protein LOC142467382 isoform X2 [Ascaphus truei]|uniref:uncharacterized protein LOC142467382 isoform X2 n=1 Tax=Ascaphus truei TaxID=8439 RepID=UPI003F597E3D
MHRKSAAEILLRWLSLSILLPAVMMVDSPNEVHMKVGDSLLLLGKDINESSIFNAEWMLKREGEKSSIAVFSQLSNPSTMKIFTGRVSFFNGNVSIWIHNLTVDDSGKYVQDVILMNGKMSSHELLITVSRPVSNVTVSSSSSCPRAGGNVTLRCDKIQGTAVTYTWHLCQKPLMEERHCRSWHFYGYFGYPGYLGYFLIILFVFKKTRKVKKRNSKRDMVYENAIPAKKRPRKDVSAKGWRQVTEP